MAEGRRDRAVEVELSLRLRTGDSSSGAAAAAAEEEAAAARRRRSMTIFYNGRVCAVSVTELQARTIISMANQGNFTKQQQQSRQHCVAGSSQNDTAEAPPPPASPRDGLEAAAAAVAAPTVVNQAAASGLSMKRSLQRFLEKRKTRAAAAAPLYAGDRPAARR